MLLSVNPLAVWEREVSVASSCSQIEGTPLLECNPVIEANSASPWLHFGCNRGLN
jgi:hypothetical protein